MRLKRLPFSPATDIATPSDGRFALRRRVRLRALSQPAPADARDASGLKWQGSLSNWWIVCGLLRWACRNNRD